MAVGADAVAGVNELAMAGVTGQDVLFVDGFLVVDVALEVVHRPFGCLLVVVHGVVDGLFIGIACTVCVVQRDYYAATCNEVNSYFVHSSFVL